ncbi:MAG: Dabb family protein [Propionibacteriaceae bacterium]|jgi:glutamine synthetase|nr:Dabb family protein [Propionibacteriaceae bacterium]
MYVQIALLKWKPELTAEQIDQTLAQYSQLNDIEGVLDVTTAENTSPWARGYTHVIYIRVRDDAGMAALKADPRRKAFSQQVDAMEEHGLGIAFQAPEAGKEIQA